MSRFLIKRLLLIAILSFVFVVYLFWNRTNNDSHNAHGNNEGNPKSFANEIKTDLAVIVPFRDRFNELLAFIPHMHAFLRRQNIKHKFYIINQVDHYRFNRGSLINAGFLLSFNESKYFVMHDVDLLPLNDQLSYGFPQNGPFHVSSPKLHPQYHYSKYVGGILVMQHQHFTLINGFSNNYWGWGLEDDEFYARIRDAKLVIHRPKLTTLNQNNSFLHLHDKSRKRDKAKWFNQREITKRRDRKTGLDNISYRLVKVHRLTVEQLPLRVYDVELFCDVTVTPWCLAPSSKPAQ